MPFQVLVVYRRKLVEVQATERNRLLKVLEGANIKLSSVAKDVFGVSGRLMLCALIDRKTSPQEMAKLAKARPRAKIQKLEPALEGQLEPHHRFLLRLQLGRVEAAVAIAHKILVPSTTRRVLDCCRPL